MRTASYPRSISTKTLSFLAFAALALGILATDAEAAPTPTPSIKALAVTAPSHLPPRQSEVQRVTVEAEGGSFTLGLPEQATRTEGAGTPVVTEGHLTFTEGSAVATIESVAAGAAFEVGARIAEPGVYGFVETTILSCSSDCKTPGSTVTLSNEAFASETDVAREIFTKQLSGVTGTFSVGEEIQGTVYDYFPPETFVTAVGPGTLTLSKATGFEYLTIEGEIGISGTTPIPAEQTAPLGVASSAEEVQTALEGLHRLGAGSVTVTGGPGGDAAHPYLLAFGGKFTNEDVEEVVVDKGGLVGEHAFVKVFTTVPGGNGTGEIDVLPSNVGGLPTSGTLTAKVGPLPAGVVISGNAVGEGWLCPNAIGEASITCTSSEPVRSLHSSASGITIPVEVQSSTPMETTVPVELSGGGSPHASSYQMQIIVSKEPAKFGIAAAWAGSFEADGSPSIQAGGHPYDSAAYFIVNSVRLGNGALAPAGDSKNVVVDLPPGFVGNPLAGKRCPQSQVFPAQGSSPVCNQEMSVGNLDAIIENMTATMEFHSRLYNDVPPKGVAAEFTTVLAYPFQSVLANVNSEEDFGIRLTAPNNANYDQIFGAFTAFEGVPAEGNGQALLTNPVNCAESAQTPPLVRATASTYQDPNTFPGFDVPQPALVGCENLAFEGVTPQTPDGQVAFSFFPTSEGNPVSTGSTPVGATAHLHINQPGLTDPNGLATPELKRSVIKLPAGLSLNPSQANGLQACSEAQIGFKGAGYPMPNPIRFTEAQPSCPDASKLGTAEIQTPLLDNPLVGEVFLATPYENPYGSLISIYLVVNDPLTGVIIKLPGEVQADPVTGRLTTIFDNNPQLPFTDLILKFRGGGPRSEFATSEVCGSFPTEGEWTPWSAPESGPPAQTSDSFDISSGCSPSPAARPFAPSFEAGTTAPKAGAYSPLVVKVNRKDGEQELTKLDFTLPKGLIGKLAGIPYCSEAQIQAAEAKTGKAEQANPSCPAASKVGSVDTAAGVGSEPFHVGGSAYLSGPYKGAPLSAVVVTPALAGPFDLGDVVIRAPLYIDPESAQLTTRSDPIPTILKGIPLKVRSVTINVDRPGFILNPTSCTPMSASAAIAGSSGALATPSNRFQVGGCESLGFAPKLALALKGGVKRAANPALTATLTQPAGQAGIGKVSVALPHSEFLDQSHIGTVCTRVQFAAAQCPAASIYGEAEAITPLLDSPLKGPVYLRSSSNKLPDLVVALKGPASQPIEVTLDGRIDSVKGGIRNSFELVPDAPVSKFVLRMQGGKKGLLVNSTNICRKTNKATVKMEGQNGKPYNFSTPLKAQCAKKSKKSKTKKSKPKSNKRRQLRPLSARR